jgi:hypothetical protein
VQPLHDTIDLLERNRGVGRHAFRNQRRIRPLEMLWEAVYPIAGVKHEISRSEAKTLSRRF